MHSGKLFVRTNIHFADAQQALEHIGETMLAANVVHASYPQALLEREAVYPTGIALEQHAVAIPHCAAEHAREPTIYLIRPDSPVAFAQADDDGTVEAALIIALVVTAPAEQLVLLRRLFGQLQHPQFLAALLEAPEEELASLFQRQIFTPSTESLSKTEHSGALS